VNFNVNSYKDIRSEQFSREVAYSQQ